MLEPMGDPLKVTVRKQGVVAVLRDAQGRHLFIRRGLSLARAPGFWCFVGGEVEDGESFAAAIVREVQEEVGLAVQAGGKVHETVSPNGEFLLHWLEVHLQTNAPPTPHPLEVAEFRWLYPQEALALEPMLPALREWLARGCP